MSRRSGSAKYSIPSAPKYERGNENDDDDDDKGRDGCTAHHHYDPAPVSSDSPARSRSKSKRPPPPPNDPLGSPSSPSEFQSLSPHHDQTSRKKRKGGQDAEKIATGTWRWAYVSSQTWSKLHFGGVQQRQGKLNCIKNHAITLSGSLNLSTTSRSKH